MPDPSEELSISLCESEDPSGHYYIQGTVPSIGHVPLLWLPVDTAEISGKEFCKNVAAFGCEDGRVIILDFAVGDDRHVVHDVIRCI